MCFGGKDHGGDDSPAPRPASSHSGKAKSKGQGSGVPERRAEVERPVTIPEDTRDTAHARDYAPPPGPPPSSLAQHPSAAHGDDYAPPSGPPPGFGQGQRQDDYAPPPGPPPASHDQPPDYAPPPGPPPTANDWASRPPPPEDVVASQSGHNWQSAVPDTSAFLPPPAIFSGFYVSPASNSTEEAANAGEDWCAQHPLVMPMSLDQPSLAAQRESNLRMMEPAGFNGRLERKGHGWWQVAANNNCPDRCFIAYPPLYTVNQHDPTRTNAPKTIYYEVKLHAHSKENFVALGFTALPYPSFRMPGWHRGSLAVHGDDGHKYINDRWGGKSFTEPFTRGSTYGIGMTLKPTGTERPHVEIFFTKDGRWAGSWDLHEETDADEDLPVTGLEGFHDLSCAVGTYNGVSCDVIFDPAAWMYQQARQ